RSVGTLVTVQPELHDAYAAAVAQAAEGEDIATSGSVPEAEVQDGRFAMPAAERVPDKAVEKLLLIATVEEFLGHQLALREPAHDGVFLVFPSQFKNAWPGTNGQKGRPTHTQLSAATPH